MRQQGRIGSNNHENRTLFLKLIVKDRSKIGDLPSYRHAGRHEFTAIKSPNHVVQTKPLPENAYPENQSLVLIITLKSNCETEASVLSRK